MRRISSSSLLLLLLATGVRAHDQRDRTRLPHGCVAQAARGWGAVFQRSSSAGATGRAQRPSTNCPAAAAEPVLQCSAPPAPANATAIDSHAARTCWVAPPTLGLGTDVADLALLPVTTVAASVVLPQRRGPRSVRGGSLLLMLVLLAAVFPPWASAVKLTEHECYTGLSAASTSMRCEGKGLTGAFLSALYWSQARYRAKWGS